MLGVDYSAGSIALATRIGAARGAGVDREATGDTEGDDLDGVEFWEWDVLTGDYGDVLPRARSAAKVEEEPPGDGWHVVLDKGTFDAVSLSAEEDAAGRRVYEAYGQRVFRLVRPGGLFLVTSCNWTEEELKVWFEKDFEGGRFVADGRVEYRAFSFGGVKGQTISTVCFQRVAAEDQQ